MNSRRKFLHNTGLAAAAIIIAKPFNVIASAASPFYRNNNKNGIILLYTGHTTAEDFSRTAGASAALRNSSLNPVLMNAPGTITDNHLSWESKKMQLVQKTGYDRVMADVG